MSQSPPPPQPGYQPPPGYRPPPPQSGMSGGMIALIVGIISAVVVVIVVLALIAILLPALGAARRTARRMQNSTQLRGIHLGMVTYANSNKEWYPGLNSAGEILPDSQADTGGSGAGDTVEARYWVLLDADLFTPDYAISPSETNAVTQWAGSGRVTANHFSYAMLEIDGSPGRVVADEDTPHRVQEWSQTLNAMAIVMGDRNAGSNASSGVQSIHTSRPGDWKGSILWNDNHVAFEQNHISALETRYGSGPLNSNDNLFEAAGETDAHLIHTGDR